MTNHAVVWDSFYILACPGGTYGSNCSTCPEDWYGLLCGQKCNCNTDQYCDPVDGCSGILNFDISIFHRIIGLIKKERAPLPNPVFDNIHAQLVYISQKSSFNYSIMRKRSETIWYAFFSFKNPKSILTHLFIIYQKN